MMNQTLTAADILLHKWPHLRKSERIQALESLPREYMDDFFLSLDSHAQSDLVLALPAGERRLYVRLLAPDDAADLIQASPKAREELMGLMDDMTSEEAKALLDYREDVAGGLMNPRFTRLRPEESIDQAITYLGVMGRRAVLCAFRLPNLNFRLTVCGTEENWSDLIRRFYLRRTLFICRFMYSCWRHTP